MRNELQQVATNPQPGDVVENTKVEGRPERREVTARYPNGDVEFMWSPEAYDRCTLEVWKFFCDGGQVK